MTDNVFRVAEVIAKSDQIVRSVTHGIVDCLHYGILHGHD